MECPKISRTADLEGRAGQDVHAACCEVPGGGGVVRAQQRYQGARLPGARPHGGRPSHSLVILRVDT
eukprot:2565459-Lingulodinium_polyedra.AAC.1